MNWKVALQTILLGCFLFVAGTWQAASAAPPTDACALLTPAQVRAVLGVTVGDGQHLFPSSSTLCGYGRPGAPKRVVVALISVTMFTQEKTPIEGIKKEAVAGLGDEAHFITTPGIGTGLSVRKGNVAFKVRVYGFAPEQVKQKEKTLVGEALAKL